MARAAPPQGFESEGDSSQWAENDWLGNSKPAASGRPAPAAAGVPKSNSTPQFHQGKKPAVDDDEWGKW